MVCCDDKTPEQREIIYMKIRIVVMLAVLAISANCWAAALTASVTGDINNAATFGGTEFANGDTITINDGITLTIPAGVTAIVGASPADDVSTPAIQCASATGTGVLVVNGTLRFAGTIKQANATWTVNAGGALLHDSSAAAAPATTYYSWQIGMAANQANAKLILQGTGPGASRVTVGNYTGSGRFGGFSQGSTIAERAHKYSSLTGALAGAGRVESYYVTFTGLGVTGYDWLTANIGAGHRLIFEHCIITDCTMINIVNTLAATGVWRFSDSSILAPRETNSIHIWTGQAISEGGERSFTNSVVEGSLVLTYGQDVTYTKCLFAGKAVDSGVPIVNYGGTHGAHHIGTDLGLWNRETGNVGIVMGHGDYTRVLSVRAGPSASHSHFRFSSPTSYTAPLVMNGMVTERVEGGMEGGIIVNLDASANANSITLNNVLDVPSYLDGAGSCNSLVVNETNNPNMRVTISGYTAKLTAANTGVFDFESYEGAANQIAKINNNLVWAASANANSQIVWKNNIDAAANAITMADYNCSYNLTKDPLYYEFATGAYANPPGAHDITANPNFVDPTRNIITWAATIDPTKNTPALILAEMLKMNDDSGYNSAFDWTAYYTWVRAGFAPTNSALKGTGESGADIGAVAVQVSSSTPARRGVFWSNGSFGFQF